MTGIVIESVARLTAPVSVRAAGGGNLKTRKGLARVPLRKIFPASGVGRSGVVVTTEATGVGLLRNPRAPGLGSRAFLGRAREVARLAACPAAWVIVVTTLPAPPWATA